MVLAAVFIIGQRAAAEPAVLTAMTPRRRQQAMRQVRRREPVAGEDLAGVRAVAAEATGQRVLGWGLALLGVELALLVASVSLSLAVEVFLVVVTAAVVAAAIDSMYTAARARAFLREHPDAQQASR